MKDLIFRRNFAQQRTNNKSCEIGSVKTSLSKEMSNNINAFWMIYYSVLIFAFILEFFAGHTLRGDGMSYQSLNPLHVGGVPAQATAVVSVANAPPQTSHYTPGTLQTSAIVSGTTGNLHSLAQHAASMASSTPVLMQNQHSQGPTPASTPPAAPNDPKNAGHYSQQRGKRIVLSDGILASITKCLINPCFFFFLYSGHHICKCSIRI